MSVAALGVSTSAGHRPDNQDATAVASGPDQTILAVADGVGGRRGGARVARLAAQAAQTALATCADPVTALLGLEEVISRTLERPAAQILPGAATALAVAVIRGDTVYATSIGDCRVTVIDAHANLRAATMDADGITKWLQQRRDSMNPGELAPPAARATLHASLPTHSPTHPPVIVQPLNAGDRVVLTSDGVHDHLAPAEMGRITVAGDAQTVAGKLTATAVRHGSDDNVTAVVAVIGGKTPADGGRMGAWPTYGAFEPCA